MAARKSASNKTSAKKTSAKKTAAEKTPAKKAAAKKAPAKKTTAKKVAATKTVAKKAPAKKTTAKKTSVGKSPAKAPAKKKAAEKTSGKKDAGRTADHQNGSFSKRFLDVQREALIAQRATYERQSRSLRDEAASLVEDFQSGDVQFDEESGEGDTLNVQREQDLMMSSQAQSAIEEIDHALAKFELGTYGLCEVSGKPIPKARLEAIPWARERIEYKVGGLTSR